MKLKQIIRIIIPVLFLNFFACQQEEDVLPDMSAIEREVEAYLMDAEEMSMQFNHRISDEIVPCSTTSFEIPLVSWPDVEVGTFGVDNSQDYLIATFELDPSEEWYFQQTQLLVEISELKENPDKTRIKSKKYLFTVRHEKGTHTFMYQIPLKQLKLTKESVENCVTVAGISRLDNGYFKKGKFAIAEETGSETRHTWKSWLHEYCLADCTPPDATPVIDCANAWMEGTSYVYNGTELGYYTVLASEMDNKFIPLSVTDPVSGQMINVGEVKILFWGSPGEYDLFIEFRPLDGYDVQDAKIYVGILDPLNGPDKFKNQITFTDQNSLVFKMKTDFQPIYLAVAAMVCTEQIPI